MKHEVLVFKVFSGGLQKPSHFNSRIPTFDFTWSFLGYWKLRSFQETQIINLIGLLEKTGIIYPSQYEILRAKLRN